MDPLQKKYHHVNLTGSEDNMTSNMERDIPQEKVKISIFRKKTQHYHQQTSGVAGLEPVEVECMVERLFVLHVLPSALDRKELHLDLITKHDKFTKYSRELNQSVSL